MPDDLRERIESLRRLRDAASPLPWVCDIHRECSPDDDDDLWYATGPVHVRRYSGPVSVEAARREVLADMAYLQTAANFAPALADAYEAAAAETQRVAGLYRELAAAICGPTMTCEDHRILLLEAAKHRGEWQSASVAAKDATIAERDAEIARLKAESQRVKDETARYTCPKCHAPFGVAFDRRSNAYLCRGMVPDIDVATNFPKWVPCTFSCKAADALKGANRDE